jgi:hypothetical protein
MNAARLPQAQSLMSLLFVHKMTPILANLVWPALFLTSRMFAVWPIAAGLFVEFFFIRQATKLRGWRCLTADITMNLVSAALGVILIPLSGIIWELLATFTIYPLFNVGTFNPVTWGATALLAAGVNAVVEGWVLQNGFKQKLGRRGFWLLFVANLVSVSIAAASLVPHPPHW